jgi:hypothetical protein
METKYWKKAKGYTIDSHYNSSSYTLLFYLKLTVGIGR